MAREVARTNNTEVAETAPAAQGAMPDFMREVEFEGRGVSTKSGDMLIPMARVLQPLSPQCLPGNPAQVPGAEAGDIYIANAPNPLVKRAEGYMFQPCHFDTAWVEWRLRSAGGGFVGRHPAHDEKMPHGCQEKPDPMNPDRKIIVNPVGNQMVYTRYHAGFMVGPTPDFVPMPLYMPFASSGHTVSKQWMTQMGMKQRNGKIIDAWAFYYRIRTKMVTRNNKSWFIYDITDAGPIVNGAPTWFWAQTKADLERGRALYEAITRGEVGLDTPDETGDGSESAGPPQQFANGDDIPF